MMNGRFEYQVGDVVTFKKKHPCGSFQWKVLRVGADFRLQCLGCSHMVMLPRTTVEKSTKAVARGDSAAG